MKKITEYINKLFRSKLMKISFTVIVLSAVYFQFNTFSGDLTDLFLINNPQLFLIAFGFVMVSLFFHVIAWRIILFNLGSKVNLANSVFIYYFSALSRYVPGNYWYIFSRSVLGKQKGIDVKTSLSGTGLEMILNTIVAILFSLIGGFFGFSEFSFDKKQLSWICFILIVSFVFFLLILERNRNINSRKNNVSLMNWIRNTIDEVFSTISLPKKDYLVLLILFGGAWITQGFCFYFVLSGWQLVNFGFLPVILFSYVTGWVIGFLNPLSPNGLGTREAIFIVMLNQILPIPSILGASVIMRLLGLLGELLLAFLGWLISKKSKIDFNNSNI